MARGPQQTPTGGVVPGQVSTNGVVLAFDTYGEPAPTAVVMLQGLAEGRLFWPQSTIETLVRKGLFVVAVDNRDIGDSSVLDNPEAPAYTLHDMALDTVGLMDALNIRQAHLVGYSLGGMLAQVMALENPNRMASLVLTMTTSGNPGVPMGEPTAMSALLQLADPTGGTNPRATIGNLWDVIVGQFDYTGEDRSHFINLLLRTGYRPSAVTRQLTAGQSTPPWYETLDRLRVPVTVVHGDADQIFPPPHAQDLADRIPGASLCWLPGAGHVLCRHAAPAFNTSLTQHFAGICP